VVTFIAIKMHDKVNFSVKFNVDSVYKRPELSE